MSIAAAADCADQLSTLEIRTRSHSLDLHLITLAECQQCIRRFSGTKSASRLFFVSDAVP
jgi:hypothetical protein